MLRYEHILNFTTLDGARTVQFGFTRFGPGATGWRAYILTPIFYLGRADDLHSTHRYHDTVNNLHYVCWDPEPRTFSEMKSVVAMWTELTHTYIRTGEEIDVQFKRRCRRG
jgi:hypothetical protein